MSNSDRPSLRGFSMKEATAIAAQFYDCDLCDNSGVPIHLYELFGANEDDDLTRGPFIDSKYLCNSCIEGLSETLGFIQVEEV